ncbi:MAG: PEGA domain-containing protein [Burkholderiales bacterium]|nr:PEGA domain-containing protein [Burkholderiales bacterium]
MKDIAVSDRIILDTGDGAAISLIGDPEDAMLLATNFRDAVAADLPGDPTRLSARIGINLGPVRLVKDINGRPNIIGDGINVAQRVMAFAQPGQVLVSRSYYEVVSRLSDDYSALFHYEGAHTDKHVREHEVYAIGDTVPGLRRRSEAKRGISPGNSGSGEDTGAYPAQISTMIRNRLYRKPRFATALAVVAILSVAVVVRSYRNEAQTQVAQGAVAATRPGVAAAGVEIKPAAAAAQDKKPAAVPGVDKKLASAVAVAEKKASPGTAPKESDREVAVVKLAITPWGEVYVDGRKRGVSPPLRDVGISAGMHQIEVRNPSFASHIKTVEAKAGDQIRIKHKFR